MRSIAARACTLALGAWLCGLPIPSQAVQESVSFYGVVPDASGLLRGADGALLGLQGELRSAGSVSEGSPFDPIGPPGDGLFRVFARASEDLRTDPARIVLETAEGRLVALRLGVNEIEPRPDEAAPDGIENALAQHAANQQLFAVICSSSVGFSTLDPTRCGQAVSGSAPLAPVSLPGLATVPASIGAGVELTPSLPLVQIYADASVVLDDQQAALLGCGPYYGTLCQPDGVALGDLEASAVLQAWPRPEASFEAGSAWAPEDASVPQPGTVGAGPGCTRSVDGQTVLLPGCTTIPGATSFGRRDFVWDRSIDGSPLPGEDETITRHPFACEVPPVLPDGSINPDALGLGQDELGCQQWRSQGAALSWNALIGFAALSAPDEVLASSLPGAGVSTPPPSATPIRCSLSVALDEAGNVVISTGDDCQAPAEADELDVHALYRTDGCSFLRPQLCREVRSVASFAVTELEDDPSGEPRLRWFHESGAAYKVVEARGAFEGYLGGTLHAFGPVVSSVEGAAAGVPMLLAPPACNDGLDNDGDELVDYPDDTSCRAPAWDSEDACGHGFAQALVLIVPLWGTRRFFAKARIR